MTDFTPWSALLGGSLIGLAAGLLLLLSGRVAGVSGIAGGLLARPRSDSRGDTGVDSGGDTRGDTGWRIAFLAGLVIGLWLYAALGGRLDHIVVEADLLTVVIGGLLVGFGTRLGGGCTSGHGVCGISQLSMRSIVATLLFMASAAITVFILRHVAGGGA